MVVYRIVREQYRHELTASGVEGSWNHQGQYVLYCAETIPLAFLELMVHLDGQRYTRHLYLLDIEIPDDVILECRSEQELPPAWRDDETSSSCRHLGAAWYEQRTSLVLKVPSVIVERSYNLVINTLHPDFGRVKLLEAHPLKPDKRIERILTGG